MANEIQQAAQTAADTGKVMAAGGSGSAILFGYQAEIIGVIGGLIIGIVGLVIQWYYSRKKFHAELEHIKKAHE